MKKHFAALLALLLILSAVPFYAEAAYASDTVAIDGTSFVDDTLPADGWIAIDADGDGYNWICASEISTKFYSLDGQDGQCVVSASFMNGVGALTPDNWLVSPAIMVPVNKQLHFYVSGQDASSCAEHYGIYISTASQTDLDSFTELFTDTVDTGSGVFKEKTADLRSYAGQTVYIAFRHFDVTDMYWINLDGVGLSDAGTNPVVPVTPPEIVRIQGSDRYATSIQAAATLLGYMDADKFSNAIIATGDAFPDALAGSVLSTVKNAPILLVSSKVPASVDNALAFISKYVRSDSGTVYILGGAKAVPDTVETRLNDIGFSYRRFAGNDRFDTNLAVLEYLYADHNFDEMLFCDGTNWPDAATASAVGLPIMLVPKKGLTDAQSGFMKNLTNSKPIQVDVIGGEAAVSKDVLSSLSAYAVSGSPRRIYGSNRAETAVAVATRFFTASDVQAYTFAYGANFPDCIAGGLLANALKAPILYGDSKAPASYKAADVPYMKGTGAWRGFVLGGPGLMSDEFIIDLFTATTE